MSQDHIEIFLVLYIRSRGGFNNNSTPTQFAAAYKYLRRNSTVYISKCTSTGRYGNCTYYESSSQTTLFEEQVDFIAFNEDHDFKLGGDEYIVGDRYIIDIVV